LATGSGSGVEGGAVERSVVAESAGQEHRARRDCRCRRADRPVFDGTTAVPGALTGLKLTPPLLLRYRLAEIIAAALAGPSQQFERIGRIYRNVVEFRRQLLPPTEVNCAAVSERYRPSRSVAKYKRQGSPASRVHREEARGVDGNPVSREPAATAVHAQRRPWLRPAADGR
jgi:hypothetical protein